LLQSVVAATVPSAAGVGANGVRPTLYIDEQTVKVIA
jgi:hypothetical protein